MRTKSSWTIAKLRRWIQSSLENVDIDSSVVITDQLLAYVFGGNRVMLYTDQDRPATSEELDNLRPLVKRALAGEPVQYIVGESFFLGRLFYVNKNTLIPRSSTETVVMIASELISEMGSILEIGTGTGCIAISLALKHQNSSIMAIDCSSEAIEVAKKNACRHKVEKISFLEGDLFESIPKNSKFSLIVSNPPYIPTSEYIELDSIVKNWEPRVALDGGVDGLLLARKLAQQASTYLLKEGYLLLELTPGGARKLSLELKKSQIWGQVAVRPDQYGDKRILIARKIN